MDDKSLPYNLRLRKASAPTEPSKINQKHERDFQEKGDEEIGLEQRCEKCGCRFGIEISLHSHHCKCKNKMSEEGMENQVVPEMLDQNNNNKKSFRKRSRKGIPTRAPLFSVFN
ncbi:uncharacterized protein LOC111017959 [Momordica charantia]|uniref:Uncharacterized protein LOC111017959 n=1 Tax=Momordica charantia TaxID=3673 RepID=A0A6J1D739_MOMCH|nr:uncharacterized protein LOC111017959 [Momordica charantia]